MEQSLIWNVINVSRPSIIEANCKTDNKQKLPQTKTLSFMKIKALKRKKSCIKNG